MRLFSCNWNVNLIPDDVCVIDVNVDVSLVDTIVVLLTIGDVVVAKIN